MNLGFDGDLATIATASAGLTKFALFPLAQLRRRVDRNGDGEADDDARGAYYVHPDLQGVAVLTVVSALGLAVAGLTGEPVFPVLSAAISGWAMARAAHEGVAAVRR